MPAFPSEAWCRHAIALFNDDPEAAHAAEGWDGDLGIVFAGDEGVLAAWVGPPEAGRLPAPQFFDAAELERRQPRYFARASVDDWKALIRGELDPIAAIVQRRLIARGDLTPIIARLKYRGVAERWLARIELESEGNHEHS